MLIDKKRAEDVQDKAAIISKYMIGNILFTDIDFEKKQQMVRFIGNTPYRRV